MAPLTRSLLNALLYFPTRAVVGTPADAALDYRELRPRTGDGQRLHAWWIASRADALGHVLFCHGNGGDIGERVPLAGLLAEVGFDVLLFDYRGYGHSTGRPSEEGTYRDVRAALACLLQQPETDASRVHYVGESLGGAVALELALAHRPATLALLSTFTSIRDMSRLHYQFIPRALVPDAYPSLRRVRQIDVPLLVVHGERDDLVPISHGRRLFEAAGGPKRLRSLPGVGHDLTSVAGDVVAAEVAAWAREHGPRDRSARPTEARLKPPPT